MVQPPGSFVPGRLGLCSRCAAARAADLSSRGVRRRATGGPHRRSACGFCCARRRSGSARVSWSCAVPLPQCIVPTRIVWLWRASWFATFTTQRATSLPVSTGTKMKASSKTLRAVQRFTFAYLGAGLRMSRAPCLQLLMWFGAAPARGPVVPVHHEV